MDERMDIGMDEPNRCPTCRTQHPHHHPACPETDLNRTLTQGPPCVCDQYGPTVCGCVPRRLTERVHEEWSPKAAGEILDAIAALFPGEVRRRRYCPDGCGARHTHVVRGTGG